MQAFVRSHNNLQNSSLSFLKQSSAYNCSSDNLTQEKADAQTGLEHTQNSSLVWVSRVQTCSILYSKRKNGTDQRKLFRRQPNQATVLGCGELACYFFGYFLVNTRK